MKQLKTALARKNARAFYAQSYARRTPRSHLHPAVRPVVAASRIHLRHF